MNRYGGGARFDHVRATAPPGLVFISVIDVSAVNARETQTDAPGTVLARSRARGIRSGS